MADNDKPPVIKLAQPGYDVKTAGDENLIYNSNWPLLKIHKQGSYQTSNIAVRNIIVDHELGFIPFFWYFANTPIAAWDNSGAVGKQSRSEFMGPLGDGAMEASDKQLIFEPNSATPSTSGAAQLYFYLFALDLTKQYTAPIIKVGAIAGPRGNKVFKIAKSGKDVDSDNLFDYIIHSRTRSPLIHSVNPSPGSTKSFTVDHNLGYLPLFFGFEKTARGTYKAMFTGQAASSSFQSSDKQIIFADSAGKEITIVILKDPFAVDYSVSVSI